MKRIAAVFTAVVLCFLTVARASAETTIIGTSKRAMSPNMTSQSFGAKLEETALGCYVADSMRLGSDAEIAIVCGGNLSESLPGGSLTAEDARSVFSGDQEVAVIELTPAQLFDLLEYAVSTVRIDEAELLDRSSGSDCFPQISGFSFEFDVSQMPGQRLRLVTLEDGTKLSRESQKNLTVALPMDALDGTLDFPMLQGLPYKTAGRLSELLIMHIQDQGEIVIPEVGRIHMIGTADDTIYNSLHVGSFLPYVILLVVLVRLVWRSRKSKN